MPSHSDLPGYIDRGKFLRALSRLGFEISTRGGDGSHVKITWRNGKSVTIPQELRKQTLGYICKEIEVISGINWEEIKNRL